LFSSLALPTLVTYRNGTLSPTGKLRVRRAIEIIVQKWPRRQLDDDNTLCCDKRNLELSRRRTGTRPWTSRYRAAYLCVYCTWGRRQAVIGGLLTTIITYTSYHIGPTPLRSCPARFDCIYYLALQYTAAQYYG
jgi:hypothetical protein